MRVRPIALLGICGLMAIAGCGQSNEPTFVPISSGPAPTPTATPDTVATSTRPGDLQVPLVAQLYAAGSPCDGVTTTSQMYQVSSACQLAWAETNLTEVPGSSLLTQAPMPNTATITQGVSVAAGTTDAEAYYKWQALDNWALGLNDPSLLTLVDGPFSVIDPFVQAENQGETVQGVPSCFYPTSIRVINVNAAAEAYIATQGLDAPSPTAILASFSACAGVKVFDPLTDKTITFVASTHAFSQVYTGSVQSDGAFGDLWVISGWADCGAPAMASVCN